MKLIARYEYTNISVGKKSTTILRKIISDTIKLFVNDDTVFILDLNDLFNRLGVESNKIEQIILPLLETLLYDVKLKNIDNSKYLVKGKEFSGYLLDEISDCITSVEPEFDKEQNKLINYSTIMKIKTSNTIKHIREHFGLSELEFAFKIGVTEAHVRNLERGAYYPSIKLLNRIALVFNCDIDIEFTFE